jgi:hypothetical protein
MSGPPEVQKQLRPFTTSFICELSVAALAFSPAMDSTGMVNAFLSVIVT